MSDSPAAGWKALSVTYHHARRQTGLVRALRVLSSANQASGFDCPGCAWPDPETRSPFEFCENGAKAILDEATTRSVDARFFGEHSVDSLRTKSERWLNAQGRIAVPVILRKGASHFEPLTYEAALDFTADHLRSLESPHRAAFYTSGRASNESAFLYQLVVRAFGTNNLPDCSNLCHESSGVALKETLGIGKGTVRLDDFKHADLIFVIGQNPGTNHPRMLSSLRDAKLRGATIISVNPLVEKGLVLFAHPQEPEDLLGDGVKICDEFVRVDLNGDQAFFRGLNKSLLESPASGAIDRVFIEEYCQGFATFVAKVRETSWTEIERDSGVGRAEIERIAGIVLRSKRIICTWAMGLTQHENAVVTIQEVTNFLLLRGNVGRLGAGACPVRGHSNVQGDRTVGIAPTLPDEFARKLGEHFGFEVPRQRGFDTVTAISKMLTKEVEVLVSLGGNFLSASPDTTYTARALSNCSLCVHIATKLNKSHLSEAETTIVLPCLGRTERDTTGGRTQFVTVENSMGVVHRSEGHLPPASGGLWSEPAIVAELGARLLEGPAWRENLRHLVEDYDRIRDVIAEVIDGFEDFSERVRAEAGFELPNGPRERRFTTESGKAHFVSTTLRRLHPEKGELLLTTVRSHDQFNTTVYTNEDRYRGVGSDRKVLLLHPLDLEERDLKSGDRIRIQSHFARPSGEPQTRSVEGFSAVAYDIPKGVAAAYFPEANPLIFLESYAERSLTPTSKSIRVSIEKMTGDHASQGKGSRPLVDESPASR